VSPSSQALRARVARRYGAGYLPARRRAFEARLAALAPPARPETPPAVTPDRLPSRAYGFAERRRDLVQWIAALRALERAAPLRAGVWRQSDAHELALRDGEARALAAHAEDLEQSLVALLASERVDGGLALLVGMARLDAVRRSVAAGRLVLLDDLPAGAEAHEARADDPYLAELRAHAAARLERARAQLLAPDPLGEADYDALEEAGNAWLDVAEPTRGGGARLRLYEGERIPAPAAVVGGLPEPALPAARLRAAAARARARERDYERALREAFAYHVLTRNCVTELFATLAGELGAEEASRVLGGPAEPPGPLRFVPFASFDAVLGSWRVARRWRQPALRRERLAELYDRENDLRVYLRESNTLTSTLYRPAPEAPFFLFFTDDAALLRPLLGAGNLVAAVAQSALGLLQLPRDRGAALREGLTSAAYSLPELAFVSIRKGAMRYAPPPEPAPGESRTRTRSGW
jgi:hypothetical protein